MDYHQAVATQSVRQPEQHGATENNTVDELTEKELEEQRRQKLEDDIKECMRQMEEAALMALSCI